MNNLRFELQNNARENLQRFSWQMLAEQTLKFIKIIIIIFTHPALRVHPSL
jgi:hypothetical protein